MPDKEDYDYKLMDSILESDMHLVITVKVDEENDAYSWFVDNSGMRDVPFLIEIAKKYFQDKCMRDD